MLYKNPFDSFCNSSTQGAISRSNGTKPTCASAVKCTNSTGATNLARPDIH